MDVGELLQRMGNFAAVKRLALGVGYRTQGGWFFTWPR
jgi:hypothetical protein